MDQKTELVERTLVGEGVSIHKKGAGVAGRGWGCRGPVAAQAFTGMTKHLEWAKRFESHKKGMGAREWGRDRGQEQEGEPVAPGCVMHGKGDSEPKRRGAPQRSTGRPVAVPMQCNTSYWEVGGKKVMINKATVHFPRKFVTKKLAHICMNLR